MVQLRIFLEGTLVNQCAYYFFFSLLKLGFLVMLALCNPFKREKRIFSPFVHATPAKLLLKRLFSYGEISPTISLTLMGGIC